MNLSRRNLLKSAAAGAAVLATGTRLPQAFAADKKIPIGLQLYSVRNECEKDLPGVLKAVSGMGYKGVEFAGYYGRNAEELRKLLDENKLVCCGTHAQWPTLSEKQWNDTVKFNKTIGNKYLIVPYLDPKQFFATEAKCKEAAKVFSELAAKAKAEGMLVGYHAHGGDFNKVGDSTAWDIFFSNCSPDVVMQLDIGNCLGGGGDPYAILEKFVDRAVTIHLKEHGGPKGAAVGEGDVKWDKVFQLCEKSGKTEWYIVEQESYAGGPLDAVKQCIVNLKKMGKW